MPIRPSGASSLQRARASLDPLGWMADSALSVPQGNSRLTAGMPTARTARQIPTRHRGVQRARAMLASQALPVDHVTRKGCQMVRLLL